MKSDSPTLIGALAALAATAVWAGNFIAARALADHIPPLQFNFWRWVVAFFTLLPFGLGHLKEDLAKSAPSFKYLSIMALLGVTLMNSFIYKAGQTAESINMAIMMQFTPAIIMVCAFFVYGEKLSLRGVLGVILATCGILLLICRGNPQTLLNLRIDSGDLWTLGCMICFALYSLFMRQRPKNISPLGFNIIVFGLGIIYSVPLVLMEIHFLYLPTLNFATICGILYSGLGCSALAFWLWTVAIDRLGPVRAGFIYYLLPFFAVIMAKIVLDENIYRIQIIGGMMVIGGIFFATWHQRAHQK